MSTDRTGCCGGDGCQLPEVQYADRAEVLRVAAKVAERNAELLRRLADDDE